MGLWVRQGVWGCELKSGVRMWFRKGGSGHRERDTGAGLRGREAGEGWEGKEVAWGELGLFLKFTYFLILFGCILDF